MKIEIRNVTVSSGNKVLLNNISAEFHRGRVVAVLGRNGAGKTTLLKATLGLLNYSGEILIDGQNIRMLNRAAMAKKIGYVPQRNSFIFPYSVTEFINMSRFVYMSSKDDVALRSLKAVSGEELAERRLNELSGGELQKVVIAASLAQEPRYILFDEPTTYLDPVQKLEVERLLRSLSCEHGIGVCVVTHDLNSVSKFADDIIIIRDGNIASQTSVIELNVANIEHFYAKSL